MESYDESNIRDLIDKNPCVVVQIGASWCTPCKQLRPKIEKISLDNPNVVFAYVDIDKARKYSTESDVMSLPTVIGYHLSVEIGRVGGNNENSVKDLVNKLRARVKSP